MRTCKFRIFPQYIYIYIYIYTGNGLVWFGWFYGISTFVGYLTPNPFLCK